jgi:hypothetical protein
MKEKILTFLKSKLTGVSESFLLGVAETFSKTINDEKEIDTVFTDGVIETLKFSASQLQIEGDRRATEAQKTALKNFQEKHGLKEDGTPIKPPKQEEVKPNPDEPAWFTAFKKEQQASTDALKAELDAQKQEKTLTALADKVKSHDKLKDIPKSFLNNRNLIPKSEDEIDQLVSTIEADYNSFTQEMAEKGVIISKPSAGGGSSGKESNIDDYLDETFPKEPKGKVLIDKN